MNKIRILVVIGCLLAGFVMAGAPQAPFGTEIGTNSVVVMPPRALGEGFQDADCTIWVASAAATAGSLIKSTNSMSYYLVTGTNGTFGTTAPSHVTGSAVNGNVTLMRIEEGRRKGMAIVNVSTVNVFLSLGSAAQLNKGVMLTPNGAWVDDGVGCPQAYISVVAASGTTNLVTGIEW